MPTPTPERGARSTLDQKKGWRIIMKNTIPFIVFSIALATNGYSSLVGLTNIELAPISYLGANYCLTIFQNEEATDPTSIWIDASGDTLSIVAYNVDEGSDWYLTSYGDSFNQSTITAGEFPVFLRETPAAEMHDITVGYGDFYLSVVTGQMQLDKPFPPRDVYGWVHLQNTGGSLSMIDNAVAYNESGIIVGVPEPSSGTLFLGGLVTAIGVRVRRRSRRTIRPIRQVLKTIERWEYENHSA